MTYVFGFFSFCLIIYIVILLIELSNKDKRVVKINDSYKDVKDYYDKLITSYNKEKIAADEYISALEKNCEAKNDYEKVLLEQIQLQTEMIVHQKSYKIVLERTMNDIENYLKDNNSISQNVIRQIHLANMINIKHIMNEVIEGNNNDTETN